MRFVLLLSVLALTGCAAQYQAGIDRQTAWKQEVVADCNAHAEKVSAGFENPDITRLEKRRAFERCIRYMIK